MSSRRWVVAAVAAVGLAVLVLLPARASERSTADSVTQRAPATLDTEVVEGYARLLGDAALADLGLPMDAVPGPDEGVLGAEADGAARKARFLAALREAAARAAAARAERTSTDGAQASGPARCNGDFSCFKACTLPIESGGDYGAVSPGGTYRGAWQFDRATWAGAVTRAGHPEWSGRDPAQAPSGVQDAAARQLYGERGNQPWGGRC